MGGFPVTFRVGLDTAAFLVGLLLLLFLASFLTGLLLGCSGARMGLAAELRSPVLLTLGRRNTGSWSWTSSSEEELVSVSRMVGTSMALCGVLPLGREGPANSASDSDSAVVSAGFFVFFVFLLRLAFLLLDSPDTGLLGLGSCQSVFGGSVGVSWLVSERIVPSELEDSSLTVSASPPVAPSTGVALGSAPLAAIRCSS